MKCPTCKTVELLATKLEEGLPAMGCPQCEGASVTLLYYRDWVERTTAEELSEDLPAGAAIAVDSPQALVCAKCSRLMTKLSISGATDHKLDLCTSCDEAWLDGGEWQLLKSLKLAREIPSVLTEAWQRRVRSELMQAKRKARFEKTIGVEDMKKVEDFYQWLSQHPKRTEIRFYLNSD